MVPRNLVRLAVRTDQDRLQLDMLATTGGGGTPGLQTRQAGRAVRPAYTEQAVRWLLDAVASWPGQTRPDRGGAVIELPGGASPASLTLESAGGELLLEVRGVDGAGNAVTNPAGLGAHVAVRVRLDGGGGGGHGGVLVGGCDVFCVDPGGVGVGGGGHT